MTRKRSGSPIFDYLTTQAWALEPTVFETLIGLVQRHLDGVRLEPGQVEAIVAQRDARGAVVDPGATEIVGTTAVIPITGVIAKHASQVGDVSQPQGTSTTAVSAELRAALADPKVQSILLAIDSPGGSVDGVAALGDQIHAANDQKPVTAYIDGMGASAAYWLASQAGRVVAGKDAAVGSIGVYATVRDNSRAVKNAGVDVKLVKAGRFKGAGASGVPIESGDLAAIQSRVDAYYAMFAEAVARGRGMTADQVSAVADGQVWIGKQALERGLIDSIGSIESVLGELNRNPGQGASASVAAQDLQCVAAGAEASASGLHPQEGIDMTKATTEGAAAPATAPQPLSIERLRAESPQLLEQIEKQGFAAGVAAERERIGELVDACPDMARALLLDQVKSGVSVKDGLKAILADGRRIKADRLEEIKAAAAGQPKIDAAGDAAPKAPQTDEDRWKAEYAKDARLIAEFGDVKHYLAWKKHDVQTNGGRS